jgi:pimeloyl-ACP methyl ester carboxylesterase
MKTLFLSILSLASTFVLQTASAASSCPAPWHCQTDYVRSGYLEENPAVPFRGNVIYYEGLGDSMINHGPLFALLTEAGYRVIAFDYRGQGGSSGNMNETRIAGIAEMGNKFWTAYARDLEHFPQKTLIGWSTGGLAAYRQAIEDPSVNRIVLIAPGIVPRFFLGKLGFITQNTLTSATYENGEPNPHLDPIRPKTPLGLPLFDADLLQQAVILTGKTMPSRVSGLVLVTSKKDRFVNADATMRDLKKRAPQFEFQQFIDAHHELDNEAEPTGSMARESVLKFLESSDR